MRVPLKRKSGHSLKGNCWLEGILIQTGWAASRSKGTYLKSFYHRVAALRGKKRAVVDSSRAELHYLLGTEASKPYQALPQIYTNLNSKTLSSRSR